jgi:hypothetical protein
VVSASCGIGRGTIHHRLQAHWIASRRCSPGSCAAVSGRSSTHRIPEPRACTTCRLVFSIQGRRAVCNISCKRRRFFQSLHSFAVSGLGLGPFDSLNMLLRSRVDDVPDLDSADDAAIPPARVEKDVRVATDLAQKLFCNQRRPIGRFVLMERRVRRRESDRRCARRFARGR